MFLDKHITPTEVTMQDDYTVQTDRKETIFSDDQADSITRVSFTLVLKIVDSSKTSVN
jgi:hypothetical protein